MALPLPVQISWRDLATINPETMAAAQFGNEWESREVNLEIEVLQQRTSTINSQATIENNPGEHLHVATSSQILHNLASEGNTCAAAAEEDYISDDRIRPGSRAESSICSICTEEVCEGQDVRVLLCKHIYHRNCIDPWLSHFGGNCPLW